MGNESGAWVDEEFEALDLGDPRRDRRAKELLKRFAAKPTASIPGACDGWAETIGAYRFFGNEEVEWTNMMQPLSIELNMEPRHRPKPASGGNEQ
jgi:hypothetical protein